MDKTADDRVLERSKTIATWKREIIYQRKMPYAGHIRGSARDLPLMIMEGRIERTRGRGDREEAG